MMTLPYPNSPTGDENESLTPFRLLSNLEFLETQPEREMVVPIPLSSTLSTSGPVWAIPWGREVAVVEIFATPYLSTAGLSSSISCSVGLYADDSLSVCFGSIVICSATASTQCMANIAADLTSSLNFTSTDYIAICMEVAAVQPVCELTPITIRYRER